MTSLDPRISVPSNWMTLTVMGRLTVRSVGLLQPETPEEAGLKLCHSILPSCFDFWKGRRKRTKNLSCFLDTSRVKWKDPMAINVFGVFGNYFWFNFWGFQLCSLILYLFLKLWIIRQPQITVWCSQEGQRFTSHH